MNIELAVQQRRLKQPNGQSVYPDEKVVELLRQYSPSDDPYADSDCHWRDREEFGPTLVLVICSTTLRINFHVVRSVVDPALRESQESFQCDVRDPPRLRYHGD